MNIILLSKSRKSPINLSIKRGPLTMVLLGVLLGVPLLSASVGYGVAVMRMGPLEGDGANTYTAATERAKVSQVVEDTRYGINALAQRLGQLQAHAIRLDALGKRLVTMADLDQGEFDFDNPPAVGGPEDMSVTGTMDASELLRALDQLSFQLDDREQQLTVLETLMMNQILLEETVPAGWPIGAGWVSSHYGKRTDPFTGKKAFHYGVDFAGKEGSDVATVASGVVTWSSRRYGYGLLVEVDHGNGYVTRYGHNKANLVAVGDVVEKGQTIALIGSSGRSTGPHVHFEVMRNGRAVDPAQYIRVSR